MQADISLPSAAPVHTESVQAMQAAHVPVTHSDRGSSPSSSMPLLDVRGLQRMQVGPVHLQVQAGECVSLMGHSGAGKSVFLRMVADLDPHGGDAALAGEACSAMPAPHWRRHVTYVAADSGWWEETVAPHFAADYDFAAMLPAVGISAEAGAWPVARLSTGERQRMALLRALRPGVRVLLLDEPTSGLDPDSIERVEGLLRSHLAHGGAIVMVTHDQRQADRMAQRQFRIENGQITEVRA